MEFSTTNQPPEPKQESNAISCYELPVIQSLKYLSPTSFLQAENCELSFYFLRLGDANLPREDQTEPMAVGSAFDSFVKAEIAHSIGFDNVLSVLLKSVSPTWESVIPVGRKLFNLYRDYGAYDSLLKEGVGRIELDIKQGSHEEVILYGKPDAQLVSGVPLDWKVNGYASIHGTYPKKGYAYKFDRYGRQEGNKSDVALLEDIDYKWAVQLLFYNWLLEERPPYHGAIDQLACKDNNMQVACYRSQIGSTFADKIWRSVRSKWKRFQAGQIAVPTPSWKKCEPYSYPLLCTGVCPLYAKFAKGREEGGSGSVSYRNQVSNSGQKKGKKR